MRRGVGIGCVGLLLGCSGLFGPDADGVVQIREALRQVAPDQAVPLFVVGMSEVGAVWPPCADGLAAWANVDPSQRAAILAAMTEPTSMCPRTCGGGRALIEELGAVDPAERGATVVARCDAEGPDPLFRAELQPLRPLVSSPLEYLFLRELVAIADVADPGFVDLHDPLAYGLVLAGGPVLLDPAAPASVTGTATLSPEARAALEAALSACGEAGAGRWIVAEGRVVAQVPASACADQAVSVALAASPQAGAVVVDAVWPAAAPAAP